MAVRKATYARTSGPVDGSGVAIPMIVATDQYRVTWTGLLNGDTGSPEPLMAMVAKAVQVSGTFGVAGSVQIEGSNDQVNWSILRNVLGGTNTLVFTAVGIQQVLENPAWIRANVTAGDGTTSLTVILAGRIPID